jgi:hypothetical protein
MKLGKIKLKYVWQAISVSRPSKERYIRDHTSFSSYVRDEKFGFVQSVITAQHQGYLPLGLSVLTQ